MILEMQNPAARVYALMNGTYDQTIVQIREGTYVKNEFEKGSQCDHWYAEVMEAYSRLCGRLGVQEHHDTDVEIIIQNMLCIERYLALRMFEYGQQYEQWRI